jgi:hypothetical protein
VLRQAVEVREYNEFMREAFRDVWQDLCERHRIGPLPIKTQCAVALAALGHSYPELAQQEIKKGWWINGNE